METNHVLDDAEQRIAPARAAAHTRQKEIIDGMREEVGREHYAHAQVELPKLDKFIAKDSRPFLDHLVRISQQATTPLPPFVLAWVNELNEHCVSGTNWVREGIDEWNRLAPPFLPSTQQIDQRRRGAEVASLRTKLMSWSGKASRLRDLRAWIEQYIAESGWPTMQPASPTIAPTPLREAAAITVERDFSLKPRG